MFGASSALLLRLQGVHGEWRDDDYEDDIYESDNEDQAVFVPKRRRLAMSDDFTFAPPASQVESERKLVELLAAKQSQISGCSICLDTDSDDLHTLGCGHAFCRECIAEYLRQKIRIREIDRRRKTWLAPLPSEKICAARLHVEMIYGITCPHLGCKELIDISANPELVDAATFQIYDNHALAGTLDSMASLRKCPHKCGGWIQQDCLCTSTECIVRVMKKREAVEGHILIGRWAKSIGAKCCPQCFVPIEKNMGCDHMYCVKCKHPFLWSQAPLFGTAGHWYRPENLPEEAASLPAHMRRMIVQI